MDIGCLQSCIPMLYMPTIHVCFVPTKKFQSLQFRGGIDGFLTVHRRIDISVFLTILNCMLAEKFERVLLSNIRQRFMAGDITVV